MLYEVAVNDDPVQWLKFLVIFLVFIVDQSKEATFKVAPSKWEAVDEAELQAQGETFQWHQAVFYYMRSCTLIICHQFCCMHS